MRSKIPCAVPSFIHIDPVQGETLDWLKSDHAVIRRRQGSRDLRPRIDEPSSFTSLSSPSDLPRAIVSAIPTPSSALHRQRSDTSLRSQTRNFSRPTFSPAYAPSTPSPLKHDHTRGEVGTPSDYGSEAMISDTESIQQRLILHKHKDSGVDIPDGLESSNDLEQANEAEREVSGVLEEIIDTYSNVPSVERQPSSYRSNGTRAARRLGIMSSRPHEQTCVCHICRQTRSRRRKKTMRLTKQLEQCKASMLAVRDPADPRNIERGEIYGLWLKLARLHVSYDNLIDIPVLSIAEEEALFLAYMEVFNIITRLISLEKARWPEVNHEATKQLIVENAGNSLSITIISS